MTETVLAPTGGGVVGERVLAPPDPVPVAPTVATARNAIRTAAVPFACLARQRHALRVRVVVRASQFSAAITANPDAKFSFLDEDVEIIPFFEFYVFAQTIDPPNSSELARGERFFPFPESNNGVFAVQAPKAVVAPIVIAVGSGPQSRLQTLLAQTPTSDHVNLLASTICHEIGHSSAFAMPSPSRGHRRIGRAIQGSRAV
jgi:hypothetical protein